MGMQLIMMRLLCALALMVGMPAFAQVGADLQSGQGDALGVALFFYCFFCYVHIKDAFSTSEAKGWTAVAYCTAFGVAACYFYPLQILLVILFLFTFLDWAWRSIK